MMKKRFIFLVAVIVVLAHQWSLLACTGITLHSKDSAYVLARTMYNSAIRCIDLNTINFEKIKYRDAALDGSKLQPVHTLNLFN
ncbi:hypothetical protein [Bacteroides graminisolvens]|uniref:hypothetical protein n=1 Tax=Bacteroides graminisolvens TaxID=477666 RepID=UPI0029C668CE|nr:hypothetical protein [Bacteroides graminisolvens]